MRRSPVVLVVLLCAVTLSACADDPAPLPDAGTDAASDGPAGDVIDCSTVGCAAPPACGEECTAPCGCCGPPACKDGGAPGEACLTGEVDSGSIGAPCEREDDCPAGYTCQGFSGVAFTQSCEIRCESCECPEDTTCGETGDKAGTWMQCFIQR